MLIKRLLNFRGRHKRTMVFYKGPGPQQIQKAANDAKPVLRICNGFLILSRSHLTTDALERLEQFVLRALTTTTN